jgi:subtilisin family serine protease
MRRLCVFAFLLAACGGGGGGGTAPATTTTLSGTLSILASARTRQGFGAAAVRLREGASILDARPLPDRAVEGVVAAGAVRVYRGVAAETGPRRAMVEEGFDGDALLHDLVTGRVAESLDLDAGAAFDLVVVARGGGAFRAEVVAGAGDRAPRVLPDAYHGGADACVAGEIVVAPRDGVGVAGVAVAAQSVCVRVGPRACLLRDAALGGGFDGVCTLVARCARLEAAGLVRWAEPNLRRRLAGRPDDPLYASQWGLEQIGMPDAWEQHTGASVVVAVVDSGILAHPDLAGRVVAGWDFVDGDDDPTDPTPKVSHGTQVASILAAAGNDGAGMCGVCWSGRIMPVRAFGVSGFGTSFQISNAILFAAGLDNASSALPAEAARVANLSFAASSASIAEEEACIAARAAGVLLVAAVGNEGSTGPRYPAAYASVVGVGATTVAGNHASYSNRNAVDLVAPGGTAASGVRVAGIDASGQYVHLFANGTSFAAPHVCGVAALALSLRDRPPPEMEQILRDTAHDIDAPGFDVRTGAGLLDAPAVLAAAVDETPPLLGRFESVHVVLRAVPSGTVVYDVVTTVDAGLVWTLEGVPEGDYRLEAGTDRDFDGAIDDAGEIHGTWTDDEGADTLHATPGPPRTDLDFPIG